MTNPPVDAIREEIIMAVETTIGPERNLLDPTPESARQIELHDAGPHNEELEQLRALDGTPASHGFKAITLPMLFPVAERRRRRWSRRWSELCAAGQRRRCADGSNIIILSDRNHGREHGAHPGAAGLRGRCTTT